MHKEHTLVTSIGMLDKSILGFVLGTLNIITGYNGSGKSTLINQMCIAEPLSQGYKVFCFSGELPPHIFKYWLYQTLANNNDFEYNICSDIASRSYKDNYYIIKSSSDSNITSCINNNLYLYDDADYSGQAILAKMELLAKRKGVKCFVIDNLMKIELDTRQHEFTAHKVWINKVNYPHL
ncbi:MAG: hypothetical protein BEN19_06875 [Epulopiscium sp. Nuni2H_MBin003]|nr:MAG: hypothetical protein BEN19_06875 [Epulopiscium sp. Nuni2H_MBin003]